MFFFCLPFAWQFSLHSTCHIWHSTKPRFFLFWECRPATICNLIEFDIFNNHWLYSAFQLVFFPPPCSILVSLCAGCHLYERVRATTPLHLYTQGVAESLTFPLKAVTWPHGRNQVQQCSITARKNDAFFAKNPNEGNDSNFTRTVLIRSLFLYRFCVRCSLSTELYR